MGMFDNVTAPDVPCPKCGAPVKGWQSKDAGCNLDTIPTSSVDSYYASCGECNNWLEFRRTSVSEFSLYHGKYGARLVEVEYYYASIPVNTDKLRDAYTDIHATNHVLASLLVEAATTIDLLRSDILTLKTLTGTAHRAAERMTRQ